MALLGYYGRSRPRSALGLSLSEVVNLPYLQDMLIRHTHKNPGEGCWIWTGPSVVYQSRGYWIRRARLYVTLERGYMQLPVARLAYLFEHGIIENTRRVGHRCAEPLCVRPDHLYLMPQSKTYWARVKPRRRQQERVAQEQEMRQSLPKGLDAETYYQILYLDWKGAPIKSIAKLLGVTPANVNRVIAHAADGEAAGGGSSVHSGPMAAAGSHS